MAKIRQIIVCNVLIALVYWLVSHLNWMLFNSVGVLPMPIWPAAAVALVAALYWGWAVVPGIAVGTILANYFSLGAPIFFAVCISVMNSVAPALGASLIRKRISTQLRIRNMGDVGYFFAIGVCFVPLLSALGGVGSKCLLGLLSCEVSPISLVRWTMAHALGTLLFALPYLVWVGGRRDHE